MPGFWIFVALMVFAWYVAVTLAIVLLWIRTKPGAVDSELKSLRRQLDLLQSQVDRLRSRLDSVLEGGQTRGRVAVETPSPAVPTPEFRPEPETAPAPEKEPVAAGMEPPSAAPPIAVPPPPPPPRRTSPELEALIGGNWLLKIGIVSIVLGALYFLKYAFDNRWIGDTGRVLIGVFAGLGLLYSGEIFQKKAYPLYGQALSAGGVSILYLSIYAAFGFYSLIGQLPALLFMAVVTAVCCVLSARYSSKTLSVMGLLGGMLTPYWLRSERSNQVGLLSYLLILDAGMGLLARARAWNFLNVLSLAGTTLLFAGWADRHYTRDALWTTEAFLIVFAALYVYLFEGERLVGKREEPAVRSRTGLLSGIVVVLFFFSSQSVLSDDAAFYWVFLVCFDALLLGASLKVDRNRIAPGLYVLNLLGITAWTDSSYRSEDLFLVWWLLTAVFALFFLHGMLRRRLAMSPAENSEVLVAIGSAFGYFGLSYYLLKGPYPAMMGLFALLLALLYLVAARALFRMPPEGRAVALAFLGISISFVTLAIPIQLHESWITVAWAAEAVVLAWIGFTTGSVRLRQVSLIVLALSIVRLFGWDAVRRLPDFRLVFNPRFFTFLSVVSAVYFLAVLHERYSAARERWETRIRSGLILLASLLSVYLVSQEAWAYYDDRRWDLDQALRREEVSAGQYRQVAQALANGRQVTLSLLWSLYSIGAVVVGIVRRYRPIRLFGIALFFLAIVKVFAIDIWTLERLYRILSVIGLGVLLLAVAFLYQRFKKLLFDTEAPAPKA